MEVSFVIWYATLHVVNAGLYLAVTRVSKGWVKTLLGFCAFLGVAALVSVLLKVDDGDTRRFEPLAFPFIFGTWCAITMALTKGPFGRTFFAATLLGTHQIAVGGFCHLLRRYVEPTGLATVLACAIILGMGAFAALWVARHILRLPPSVDWRVLDVESVLLLLLVYATGIWPISVPTDTWRESVPFVIAVLMLVSYFPLVFRQSELGRKAASLALAEESMRLMADEVRTRRMAIDEARRIRHDRRHHCTTLTAFLCAKQYDRALAYVKGLDAELQGAGATRIWCENETVNAILSGCSRKALAAHVALEAEASVPHRLAISDVELVAVLANLIENAVVASGKSTEETARHSPTPTFNSSSPPTVTVRLSCQDDILRFRISNPVPEGFVLRDGLPCEKAGIGLQVVHAVMEKYSGGFDYVLEDGRLTARGFLSCV